MRNVSSSPGPQHLGRFKYLGRVDNLSAPTRCLLALISPGSTLLFVPSGSVTLKGSNSELTDKPSEDEKETVMGILVVAFGAAIVSVVFGGALGFLLGFLGGAVSATGLVIILRGER